MPTTKTHIGFTLVEALLAILITVLVMVSIIGTLFSGLAGRDAVHSLAQEQSTGLAVLGLLERDLQGLFYYNVANRQVFRGLNRSLQGQEADSIDMVTSTDSKIPWIQDQTVLRSDICEVGYRLRLNPQHGDFLELWRRESYLFDDKPFEGGTFTMLYDRIKSFNVIYYDAPGQRAEEFEEWNMEDKNRLPFAMRIEMVVELRKRLEYDIQEFAADRKRTVRFVRTFVFPENVRKAVEAEIVPMIPQQAQPQPTPNAQTAEGEKTTEGG